MYTFLNDEDEIKMDNYKTKDKGKVRLLWFLNSQMVNVTLSRLNLIWIIQQIAQENNLIHSRQLLYLKCLSLR